jgi:hypothetical protein
VRVATLPTKALGGKFSLTTTGSVQTLVSFPLLLHIVSNPFSANPAFVALPRLGIETNNNNGLSN